MFKYCLIILMFALSACQTPNTLTEKTSWEYKKFNEQSHQSIDRNNVSQGLVEAIIKDYKSNPWREEYDDIGLVSVFENKQSQSKFFKFSITYVNDIYFVYETDEKDEINDKFLLSQW